MEVWLSGVPVDVEKWLSGLKVRGVWRRSWEGPGSVLKKHDYRKIDDIATSPLEAFLAVASDKDWEGDVEDLRLLWTEATKYKPNVRTVDWLQTRFPGEEGKAYVKEFSHVLNWEYLEDLKTSSESLVDMITYAGEEFGTPERAAAGRKIWNAAKEEGPLKQVLALPGETLTYEWLHTTLRRPIEEVTKIKILEGVTTLESSLFLGAALVPLALVPGRSFVSAVASIVFPSSLQVIPDHLCEGFNSLKEVRVAEGTRVIGAGAFSACGSLKSVTLPKTLESLGRDLGPDLRNVVVDYAEWSDVRGAFQDCQSLVKIIVPATAVGVNAFSGCFDLESITLSEGVHRLNNGAFSHCSALVRVLLPKSTQIVGKNCFWWCSELKSAVFKTEKQLAIFDAAFENCKKLTTLDIHSNKLGVAETAFDGCDEIKHVNVHARTAHVIFNPDYPDEWEPLGFMQDWDGQPAYKRLFPRGDVEIGWVNRFRDGAAELASIKVMMRSGLPGGAMRRILELNSNIEKSAAASAKTDQDARKEMEGVTRPKPYSDRTRLKRPAEGPNPQAKRSKQSFLKRLLPGLLL